MITNGFTYPKRFNKYHFLRYHHLLVKIGVINVSYTGINTNMFTTKPILAKYFEHYNKYTFDNHVIDYKPNKSHQLVVKKN